MATFAGLLVLAVSCLAVASAVPGDKLKQYCAQTHVAKVGRVRRIIGGENAALKEFPHMVALGYEDSKGKKYLCAGSLITDKYVLTTATCINSKIPKYARLGDLILDSNTDDTNAVEANVLRVIKHPEYDNRTFNDLGLIELETPVKFNEFIRPACLSGKDATEENQKLIATGWGKTETTLHPPLQKVTLDEVPYWKCSKTYENKIVILGDRHICATGDKKDTCSGDSGGPLQKLDPNYVSAYDIVGITSFGPTACATLPSVFTRVSYYIEWIESIVFSK